MIIGREFSFYFITVLRLVEESVFGKIQVEVSIGVSTENIFSTRTERNMKLIFQYMSIRSTKYKRMNTLNIFNLVSHNLKHGPEEVS